jgi:hypothetical protein
LKATGISRAYTLPNTGWRTCFAKNAPWLNPLFVWLDEVFGYGKQLDPATIWED